MALPAIFTGISVIGRIMQRSKHTFELQKKGTCQCSDGSISRGRQYTVPIMLLQKDQIRIAKATF